MKGKVVKIISSKSVFKDFEGRYGVIKEFAYDNKWRVEFNVNTENKGSLTHTVSENDFEIVGEIY